MRKRTKRKVWPLINTVAHVIEGVSVTPEHQLDALRARELTSIDSFARGAAQEPEWFDMYAMTDICHQMATHGVGPEAIEACERAKEALSADWERFTNTGRMGTTGPGLQAFRDVYEYADIQRNSITRGEYEGHIRKTMSRVRFSNKSGVKRT